VEVDAAARAGVPVLSLLLVTFVALALVLVDVVKVRERLGLVSATAPCVDVTFPALEDEDLLGLALADLLLALLLEDTFADKDENADTVFVVCAAFVLVDLDDVETLDFDALADDLLAETKDDEVLLLETGAACEDDDETDEEREDVTDVSTALAVVLLLTCAVLDLLTLLLLLAALLLLTGTGTTTAGAVLDEEEDEEEEDELELIVDGLAVGRLVVGSGATTGVVLEVDDDGGAGLDEDVLLGGAGAGVDVVELDACAVLTGATEGVLRGVVEDECELEGVLSDDVEDECELEGDGGAGELLATLLCEDKLEDVL